ncbi:hypothetical protein GOQ30_03325 [Flavobacterium sp. TP390]|uniref:Uncharacterized protein n=1 Tax=Flavobacterium profundi TaxID=1774945 RepID=A0A6I4IRN9_9FLAO|nr:hypothetical protein [Flavobacterium profundi]MVO08196.1 hypothetical protein [Flavobacterium profundi]
MRVANLNYNRTVTMSISSIVRVVFAVSTSSFDFGATTSMQVHPYKP